MRDIATKTDGTSSLTAAEFNSFIQEIENAVTSSGQTLDGSAGPDTDLQMLARALQVLGQGADAYTDGGAANSFVLSPRQAGFVQPEAYFDGMRVSFRAAATNTGACTINVDGLGQINFRRAGGAAHAAGEIGAGNFIVGQYIQANNRFEEISNTTPDLAGPASPDQVAVYADSGDATGVTLTIEPGYIQPTAFTDQMVVIFRSNAQNNGTGTHQINIPGLGTRDVVEPDGSNPLRGRFEVGSWVMAVFREVRNAFEIAFVYDLPQPSDIVSCVVTSSSGTVYNVSAVPEARPPLALFDGLTLVFLAPQSNTGSIDINFQSLGNRDLRSESGGQFSSGEITTNAVIVARYIQSEDRFRAFVSRRRVLDFRDERGVVLSTPTTGILSRTSPQPINWAAPLIDPLGFFNAGQGTVVIPAGVDRVDISGFVNTDATVGDAIQANILVNGVSEVIQTASTGATNSNLNATPQATDFPVSQGDVIELSVAWVPSSGANRNLIRGRLAVRASKVTPP